MSQFLGPIHYLMYEKICNQEKLVRALLSDSVSLERLNSSIPSLETGSLEELVDLTNIHGWLSSRVERVEKRLACALAQVSDFEVRLRVSGRDFADQYAAQKAQTASELYAALNPILLDGMPCDFAVEVKKDDSTCLQLVILEDVHLQFEQEFGGNGSRYPRARRALLDGFLDQTQFQQVDSKPNEIRIERREV